MTQKLSILVVLAACMLATPALALDVDLAVQCPPSGIAGSRINAGVSLVNGEPTPLSVRLVSSIAGNANGTLGGVGIYGPLISDERTVGAFSSANPVIQVEPQLPAALVGTVATYLFIAEWEGGEESSVTTCLVEVLPST